MFDYHQPMDNTAQSRKKITLLYRCLAMVAMVVFLATFALVFSVVKELPNFGVIIDPNEGMLLQVFMSHPTAEKISQTDQVISINGKPISLVQPEDFLTYTDSIQIQAMSMEGDIRPVTLNAVEPDSRIYLESMAIPILGFLFFLPWFALIYFKGPQLSDMYLFFCGFFGGMLFLMSQMGKPIFPWINAVYLVSGTLACWSFLEFHLRYLVVSPSEPLKFLFRLINAAGVIILLFGNLWRFVDWQRQLNVLMVVIVILDILVLILIFIAQLRRNEFRIGFVRAFFLTSVVATIPLVIFNFMPYLLGYSRYVSVIVSVLPLVIIPTNYFLLLLNLKKWMRTALVILSFTTAIFIELIFVIIGNSLLPNGLPDYRVSSYWLDFLISVAVLGISLLLYFGTYRLFYHLVYGDVVATSKRLYQKGFEVIEEKDDERPLIQMGREFMREFYRYNYLNICLMDGTVMHFDEENHLELHQFNEEIMNQLIEQLAQENSVKTLGPLGERIVPLKKLEQLHDQFPHIFGEAPQYCYLLFSTQGAIGFIAAGERKENERFDLVEMRQLNYVLNQFQVVVQNLLLLDRLENTSQQIRLSGQQSIQMRENERRRIARDMHDNIIQAITAFRYQLNELYDTEKLSVSDAEADELLHHLMTITQDIRDICFDLRPPALDATGLQSALVSLVESYHSKNELYIDLKVFGENALNSLSEDVAICLYRVAQESLLNITKHAETNFAKLILIADENQITMEIQDEGKGFTVPGHIHELVADGHFGLMGAQEFLDMVNGSFYVESSPGNGATIKTVIPLVREEGENGIFYDYRR